MLGVVDYVHNPTGGKSHQKSIYKDRRNHFLNSSFQQNEMSTVCIHVSNISMSQLLRIESDTTSLK